MPTHYQKRGFSVQIVQQRGHRGGIASVISGLEKRIGTFHVLHRSPGSLC